MDSYRSVFDLHKLNILPMIGLIGTLIAVENFYWIALTDLRSWHTELFLELLYSLNNDNKLSFSHHLILKLKNKEKRQ